MNNPPQYNYNPYPLPTSTLAIISLISGILGFVMFPLIGSVVAIITGMMAQQETRAAPPRASGDGLATAGIVMGWIGVGLNVCGICVVLAAFVLPFVIALFATASSGIQ